MTVIMSQVELQINFESLSVAAVQETTHSKHLRYTKKREETYRKQKKRRERKKKNNS
jgi:hypothetical protein